MNARNINFSINRKISAGIRLIPASWRKKRDAEFFKLDNALSWRTKAKFFQARQDWLLEGAADFAGKAEPCNKITLIPESGTGSYLLHAAYRQANLETVPGAAPRTKAPSVVL